MGNTSSTARNPGLVDRSPSSMHGVQNESAAAVRDGISGSSRSFFSRSRYSTFSGNWRSQNQRTWNAFEREMASAGNDQERTAEHDNQSFVQLNNNEQRESLSDVPQNWRHSTMSRLGSRLLPDAVVRGLLSSGEETLEEGHALRQGTSVRSRPSVYHRRVASTSNERFSITGSIRRRRTQRSEINRRSVRGLFPLGTSHQQIATDSDMVFQDPGSQSDHNIDTLRERTSQARFSRIRHSLSFPLGLLGRSPDQVQRATSGAVHPSVHPTGPHPTSDDSDQLLSSLNRPENQREVDDAPHELDAVEPEARNMLSASRITSGMSSFRRIPHGLRSRSTRLIRRGEHPPLSQVLQLAAAAIAAQLSGTTSNGSNGTRRLAGDTFDGSIQNFVQTLQDAASAQAGENVDLNASEGDLPPVNFMRVFQFPNDENGTPLASSSGNTDPMELDGDQNQFENDRSVTLVLVGVRSMPNNQDGPGNENGTLGPSLDTLLSLPFLPPANILRNGSSGALFRRSDNRIRSPNWRNSMTNFNFPQQYETQRHHRARTSGPTSSSDQGPLTPLNNSPTPISESPPGPHPPPSTPADIRSGHATPNRRPSSASGGPSSALPNLNEDQADTAPSTTNEPIFGTARQRRRSDSEFARRPELSPGNSRRNGMVEPDRAAGNTGRSWLIYVVGTNVSPDHPAFTMPSLFTDNPSYEDMQMLSTLLGPAKPPVASQEDIESAGGIYKLIFRNSSLTAQPIGAMETHDMSILPGDRCLICLCDYEATEEIRQLGTCRHVFHRECIDEWLTTGRNSCPMCRGEGVKETHDNSRSSETAPTSNTTTV